jgi:hypothetical protein
MKNMKSKIVFLSVIFSLVITGCSYDNYEEPASVLSGKIVYQGQPVGVRSNAAQLELWQDGYALHAKIPVYIAQDGSFQAMLFNGEYKIVRLSGAPWENQTDTIPVTVKGNTTIDIPVTPYFIVRNESYRKEGNTVIARLTIDQVSNNANLALARLYLGKTNITDQSNNDSNATLNASAITIGQEITITASIPANLATADYLFARVGVQAAGVGELYYTSSQKIQLK